VMALKDVCLSGESEWPSLYLYDTRGVLFVFATIVEVSGPLLLISFLGYILASLMPPLIGWAAALPSFVI